MEVIHAVTYSTSAKLSAPQGKKNVWVEMHSCK